jgi:hypothetical protein
MNNSASILLILALTLVASALVVEVRLPLLQLSFHTAYLDAMVQ